MPQKLQALDLWRNVLVTNVRQAGPDLSSRQLALLLTVYLTPPPHTVRGLAATLNISKPAISRALDRLGRLGFIRRKRDETDRRNVLVQRTVKGSVFLTEFAHLVLQSQQVTLGDGHDTPSPLAIAEPVVRDPVTVEPSKVEHAHEHALAGSAD
ncbi:MarR family transcriptional regulator [Skermanella stibiiresistens SB22]|uniref:MarR family transcriptional regulator n=1 Tax=Skermanella stibiiresistens SB22 TaxID=1385369 RepID=W9GZJ4_9PROT|nr:MarR family transcriptional regulator [Skermanella stibiiresistens SB22]